MDDPGSDPSAATPWNDPDPLRSSLDLLLGAVAVTSVPDGHALPSVLDAALDAWLEAMADRYNDGLPLGRAGWIVRLDWGGLSIP